MIINEWFWSVLPNLGLKLLILYLLKLLSLYISHGIF